MPQPQRTRSAQPPTPTARRQYSLEVHGWKSQEETGDRHYFGLRSIRVVAASAAEAVADARALLDATSEYPVANWAVVAGSEIVPATGDNAASWQRWHRQATAPQGGTGA